MKAKIHPEWHPEATMTCTSCGTVWVVGSTVPERRVDICSNCHPFYTGEQRIVDTEGQVDRFYKRLQQRDRMMERVLEREEQPQATNVSAEALGLNKRYTQILIDEGLTEIGHIVDLLAEKGDDGLLDISGIGRKVLADIKRKLRTMGFELAFEMDEAE